MIIGYARVSTADQNLDRQIDLLREHGCEDIIKEKFTGMVKDREGIKQLFRTVRENDVVKVESISRIGRRTIDILSIIEQLEGKRVKFVSIKENMDTGTPTGKAMFQMMSVIAELERNLIAERVREGIEASKRRGKHIGRPKIDKEKVAIALRMYDSGEYSVKEVCQSAGISQGTLYREIDKRNLKKRETDK